MAVTLTIAKSSTDQQQTLVPWQPSMLIQRLLEVAYDQQKNTASPISFGLQFYGTAPSPGLGYLVVMLNGQWEDMTPPADSFWWLYINGQPAQVGIDEYTVQDEDTILFAYQPYSSTQHATGTNAAKAQLKVAGLAS